MVLNRIWIGMFLVSGVVAFCKLVFWQDTHIFDDMVKSLFDSSKVGFEVALGLTGMICLWMGILRVGENGGAVKSMTKAVSPLFSRLFPEVPKDHPAVGSMMMNFSANMLGLDNAATPMGLKAMKELQTLNPEKDKATDAQIMFLVLNTSGLTLIPVSVFAILASNNLQNPTSIFLPILISTYIASLIGLIIVSIKQKINLFNRVIIAYIGTASLFIGGLLAYIIFNPSHADVIARVGGPLIIFMIIMTFIIMAMKKRINIYDSFVDGAKEGFQVAISIIPYLIVILAAIAVLRGSGTLGAILDGIRATAEFVGIATTQWVDAMPVGLMKPLSGSGARGALQDIITEHDHLGIYSEAFKAGELIPMSFPTKIAATMQGSTETTFYVLAVYFGSVGITKTRYAVGAGLLADLAGIIAAIIVSYIFFG
ncbi:MAG: spore maturation protein SpmA [Crocinitomicaceae bacterium]|jgi:spore maturation protein SpmA